MATRIHF